MNVDRMTPGNVKDEIELMQLCIIGGQRGIVNTKQTDNAHI